MDNNLLMLLSFFNQYLFNEAKINIENVKYFYKTNLTTASSPLVEELVNAIDTYSFESIGEPLFTSILIKCKKTPLETKQIMDELYKIKNLSKDEIAPAAQYLNDIISSSIVKKAKQLYFDSPTEYIKFIKNVNIPTCDPDIFSSTSFDKIDINAVVANSDNGFISTNVDFINKAFPFGGGIERGQLGILCAPPGVGKTLEAMNLALWMASQGEKVLYVSCADMNWKDFIIRMGSIALGIPFAQAYKNVVAVYNNLKDITKNNLEISINPAGTVSANDIVEKTLKENFSVVFVDYDGVLKGVSEGDSMYNTFGDVYNTFTKLSIAGKLVIICSQPKIYAYHQMINLGDIGESSRKQQVVDFIWTISNTNPECPNHLYVMSLPKARRGNVGARAYVIRIEGRFIEIPKGLFDQLAADTEERHYTEQDIAILVNQYNQTYNKVQNDVNQKQINMNTPKKNPPKSPFHN